MKLRSSQVKHDSDYMWFFATPSLDSWTPAVVRRGWVATRGPPQAAPAEVVVARGTGRVDIGTQSGHRSERVKPWLPQ